METEAAMHFDPEANLQLSRSGVVRELDGPTVWIYTKAADGVNNLRIATVNLANIVGITETQAEILVNRVANAIVNN